MEPQSKYESREVASEWLRGMKKELVPKSGLMEPLPCAAHNRRADEQTLGTHVMARYWKQEQAGANGALQRSP